MTQKTLVYDDLLITLEDVFEAMGYHGEKPDEGTCRETIAVISEVRPWLRPRYCYQVIPALPDFDMGRIKERAWSDVMRTYNSNPFISGSDIFGKYDFQNFTLNAKLASVRLGHWNYGASLYYKVGDLSRLRDPRPRARLADYQLTPSVTYTTGSHTIGLAGWYHRYKEKIMTPVVKQKDPHIKYYLMSGVDYATGNVGDYAGYQREYVNHEFGGELSYGIRSGNVAGVTAVTLRHGTEYAYGQYKYEPGTYYTYYYGFDLI